MMKVIFLGLILASYGCDLNEFFKFKENPAYSDDCALVLELPVNTIYQCRDICLRKCQCRMIIYTANDNQQMINCRLYRWPCVVSGENHLGEVLSKRVF